MYKRQVERLSPVSGGTIGIVPSIAAARIMAGILFIFIISAPIVYYMVIIHLFIAKVNSFFRNAGYLFVQYGFCIVKKVVRYIHKSEL